MRTTTISRSVILHALVGVLSWVLLTSDPPRLDLLERARQTGVLRVATINGPLTVFEDAHGLAGFEYDLVSGLGEELGLRIRWQFYPSLQSAQQALLKHNADLLAAGWSRPLNPPANLLLTQSYRETQPLVAWSTEGEQRLNSLDDLYASILHVPENMQFEADQSLDGVTLAHSRLSTETLLEQLAAGEVDFVWTDADALLIARRSASQLQPGPPLGQPARKVWAVPAVDGQALWAAANNYLRYIEAEGGLAKLRDLHFRHLDRLDEFANMAFRRRVDTRLPQYRALFERAAARYDIDWRFLAAMAYQESGWDETAVSRTGVRGLMMLTKVTARELGVRNRRDPWQSVDGGARYFLQLHARISPAAGEPDRSWMALAAYNMGMGHLQDLQKLTFELGGDPHRWVDLRANLEKLMQPRWYRELRHGYARGTEARGYVANIRAYYELLRWLFPAPTDAENESVQPLIGEPPLEQPYRLRLPPIMLEAL